MTTKKLPPPPPPPLLLVLAVVVSSSSLSLTPAALSPADAVVDCTTELFILSDCLSYVTGNGSESAAPTQECCTKLVSVVSTAPLCLCQLFNTTLVAQFDITINYTAADALPSACNVVAPSRSLCPSSSSGAGGATPPSEPPITAYAPVPQAAASEDCETELLSLSDCLEYVTGNGSAPPSQSCCNEFSSVVHNNPICLCQIFNTTFVDQFGITINRTASLVLPSVCLTPDPSSLCSGVVAFPPVSSLTGLPNTSTSPSGNAAAAPPESSSLSSLLLITISASTLTLSDLLLF